MRCGCSGSRRSGLGASCARAWREEAQSRRTMSARVQSSASRPLWGIGNYNGGRNGGGVLLLLGALLARILLRLGPLFARGARGGGLGELLGDALQAGEETSLNIMMYLVVTGLYFISAFAVNRFMLALETRVRIPGQIGGK